MNYLYRLNTSCIFLFLVGCATQTPIELSGAASKYKCVTPKQKTIIAMHWDTCPLFGWEPQHQMINQKWEVISIVSPENEDYYNGEKELQNKLNKNKRDCTWPTAISEIIDLDGNSEIQIESLSSYMNPSYQGVKFNGYVDISGKKYEVSYSGVLRRANELTGYNFEDYFEACNEKL